MTKSTITREQLLEIIETDHVQCGEASQLARMALAAMDSEPVAITDSMAYAFHHALTDGPLGDDEVEEIKSGLRAAFASVTVTQPAPERAHKWSYGPIHPENCQCIECRSARINGVKP